MPADVLVTWTPDADPFVTTYQTTFIVNGTQVGVVTQPSSAAPQASYSQITPTPPLLKVGDVVTGGVSDTDSMTPPQKSPQIPFNAVTIAAVPPPPLGPTDVAAKQTGTP